MSVKLKILTSMQDDGKTAILFELPSTVAKSLQLDGKEFVEISDLFNACGYVQKEERPVNLLRMIYDPSIAVDPQTLDKTEI